MPRSEIDRLNLFVVLDFARRAFLEDAAVVHHRHIRGDFERDVEIVLDDDVSDMRGERVEDGDEVAPLGRRETRRRLVEQDEPRRASEREGDLKLPLLAMAQRRNRRFQNVVEMDAARNRTRLRAAYILTTLLKRP